MNAKRCLLLAIVVALLLPSTVAAKNGFFSAASGTLQFVGDGVEKQFDERIGPYYSMPTTGGEVTLRVGVYVGALVGAPQQLSAGIFTGPGWDRPSLTWVRVRIYDREDPSRVLYEFEGNMEAFVSQPGIGVKFSGPYGVLITKSVTVPQGATWWMGKLEVFAGAPRGHSDVTLIQGGLQAWVDAHQGFW